MKREDFIDYEAFRASIQQVGEWHSSMCITSMVSCISMVGVIN